MKILTSQLRNPPLLAAICSLGFMDAVRALDITLPTEADLQAVEYNNTPQNTGNGTGIQINARWADTVNEVIALRFNLTAWETSHGLNPDKSDSNGNAVADGLEDGDADGLDNLGEQARSTDPADADSDDDTLSDNVETATGIWLSVTNTGTSPLRGDRDLDTLPDQMENPDLPFVDASQPGTNPNKADSDSDLYSDPAELGRGSSPKLDTSVPEGAHLTILGTGDGSLPGNDLSDPDSNIDDSTPSGAGYNWLNATASGRAFFGTGIQAGFASIL